MISSTIQEIITMVDGELFINKGNKADIVSGVTLDSRNINQSNIFIAIKGNRVDGHEYLEEVYKQGAALAIIENDAYTNVDIPIILVKDSTVALQELARNHRKSLDVKVIGITGSNGKTSCKDLLSSVLESEYKVVKTQGNQNNELGVPLTLLRASEDTDFIVLEMGMENLEDIHFLNDVAYPDMGMITNVGVAHLENLGSLENIGRAKLELMDGLTGNSLFIYNGDDPILSKIIKEKETRELDVQTFGERSSNSIYLTSFEQKSDEITFSTNISSTVFKIPTIGKHMALNALPVVYTAYKIGLNDEQIASGLSSFVSSAMRNELVEVDQMIILNDAYKSNPQSARVALDTFNLIDEPYKIVVLGDMLDLGEAENQFHFDLGVYMNDITFDELIGYGELSKYILEGAKSVKPDKKFHLMETHEEIANYLQSFKDKRCAVLFKGSRGMHLDKIVDELIGE